MLHRTGERYQILERKHMSEKNMDANNTEEETSADSSTENETGDNDTSSSEGDAKDQTDFSKYPLDKHPRWAEREKNWNDRFEKQQQEFEAKLEALKPKESEQKISENAAIPKWFGGNQQQWDEYVSWHNEGIKKAKEEAVQQFSSTQSAKEKAVADANAWFSESVTAIEKEAGKTIDREALLKICVDNELIDSKQRWNYKAAWQILKAQQGGTGSREDRKKLADETGKDGGKTDTSEKGVKTAADFKKDRPW